MPANTKAAIINNLPRQRALYKRENVLSFKLRLRHRSQNENKLPGLDDARTIGFEIRP
jgi:hypothetical protein